MPAARGTARVRLSVVCVCVLAVQFHGVAAIPHVSMIAWLRVLTAAKINPRQHEIRLFRTSPIAPLNRCNERPMARDEHRRKDD